MSDPSAAVRIALDLMGGDHAPEAVVDGALQALATQPQLEVVLVGPPDLAASLLASRDGGSLLSVVAASQVVAMDEDPARAVRAKRDSTVRVACRLVRDGAADATVSVGSTGAAVAAAVFTLNRLPGVTRPPLAIVVPAPRGPLVLLDAGAGVEATPDLLAQFALAGAAYAQVRLGLAAPRVGLLNVGSEPGKGDRVRKEAFEALSRLPVDFVGNVEGHDVPVGGRADVVVTDGFTGNVLLKCFEGAVSALSLPYGPVPGQGARTGIVTGDGSARLESAGAARDASRRFSTESEGGGVLLGVDGVVVVGHGASGPDGVAACIAGAAQSVRDGLVPRVADALGELVARRRAAAGLTVTS